MSAQELLQALLTLIYVIEEERFALGRKENELQALRKRLAELEGAQNE